MALPTTSITLSRDLSYQYVHLEPSSPSKPYILFIHGFPSSANDWRRQITYFTQKGYGIIAPNCLGYGETSKPLDVEAYKGKKMASEIIAILDLHGTSKVIGVGHDWGSMILSRMANYYPDRFLKYAFVDIGYSPPGISLTPDLINNIDTMTKTHNGFECFGYFLFFQDEDAAKLMDKHPDSVLSIFHTTDNELGKKHMGAHGAFRQWLTEGEIAPSPGYLSEEDKAYNRSLFSPKNGGFGPSINYYRAALNNINAEDEQTISEENKYLQQDALMITSNNFISAAAEMDEQMKPFVRGNFTTKHVDAGHWLMLEKADEANAILEEFFVGT